MLDNPIGFCIINLSLNKQKNKIMKYEQLKGLAERDRRDCGVISISVLANVPYQDAYAACELAGRIKNHGMRIHQILDALSMLNKKYIMVEDFPFYPKGCTPRQFVKYYPTGKYLCTTRNHALAVIGGVVEDYSANGKRKILKVYKEV